MRKVPVPLLWIALAVLLMAGCATTPMASAVPEPDVAAPLTPTEPIDPMPSVPGLSGQFIYVMDSVLQVHDVGTGETLQYPDTFTYLNFPTAGTFLAVSPDQRFISFNGKEPAYGCSTFHPEQPCVDTGASGAFLLNRQTGEILLAAPYANTTISWAPQSGEFVYSSFDYQKIPDQTQMKITSPAGGEPTVIASGEIVDFYPSWSPRGDWIAFMRTPSPIPDQPPCESQSYVYNTCIDPDLYMMHPDGSEVILLLQHVRMLNSSYNVPAWSPDGTRLAVIAGEEAENIVVIKVDTMEIKLISGQYPTTVYPTWSPDGNSLLFISQNTGNREVTIISEDGSVATNLSNIPAADFFPTWSPDGKNVIYLSQRTSPRKTLILQSVDQPSRVPVEFTGVNSQFRVLWVDLSK